jgi:3-isopropylmalate dehydrogenase
MNKKIAVLAGDGIGPEVMTAAVEVLTAVADKFGHKFEFTEALIGGAAYEKHQSHFPEETLNICRKSDAILFGSVGGPVSELNNPKWKNCEVNALLGIRKAFNFNANFRPAKVYAALKNICPLRPEIAGSGIDLLIVRELLGDIYFGEKKFYEVDGQKAAMDICSYTTEQIVSVGRAAFEAARKRRGILTSVDKANVLHTSKLWREVISGLSSQYPDVSLNHMLVDNAAMQIILKPSQFDVIVTSNMFGDILSDAAAVLPGSLGLTPSASLNSDGFGMYEPSGGSAPDIAGKGIANPAAQILSAAMLLKFSFNLQKEAEVLEKAVEKVIDLGVRTADIAEDKSKACTTGDFARAVITEIKR